MKNTASKWLVLASLANLAGNSLGTIIAVQHNLRAGLGGIANSPDILQDFLGLKGTALSAPLSFMFIQFVFTLFALRPGWLGRIGIGGLTFMGLFYVLAQAGEPIMLRQFLPGGFDLPQFSILLVNIASSLIMFIMGIKAWRTKKTFQPLVRELG